METEEDLLLTMPTECNKAEKGRVVFSWSQGSAVLLQQISIAMYPTISALGFLLVEQSRVLTHDFSIPKPHASILLFTSHPACGWHHPIWGPVVL